MEWYGKPYYSLDAWCKNTLARKCYKIALNAHMTCPNRDGSLGSRGCIFCSAGGSGDFAVDIAGESVENQLLEGLAKFRKKFEISAHTPPCLIAYFQAYTNTYAPLDYLEQVYRQALDCSLVCGISIATRPDCLPDETISLLTRLKTEYPDKFIWIELGLQTIHQETADFIRRGYPLSCFEETFEKLTRVSIPVIIHLILGLPGETQSMIFENIAYLNRLKPFGVKLQLLHILKDTDLGTLYLEELAGIAHDSPSIRPLGKDEYIALVTECIRRLSPEIIVHRLTGDGPKDSLLAPTWSLNKKDVLNSIHHEFKLKQARQGDLLGA